MSRSREEEWQLFLRWLAVGEVQDAVAFGFFMMLAEWGREPVRGQALEHIMGVSSTFRLPEPVVSAAIGRPFVLGQRVSPSFAAYLDRKYHKVVSLVDFLAATGSTGSAEHIVKACETFAREDRRQWLKVAGEQKAEIVENRLLARPRFAHCALAAEFGAFVGYSCVRMAWRCSGEGGRAQRVRVLSHESDAVHVVVARHVVFQALLSDRVEVIPGMAHDSVRRLAEEWGEQAIGFTFLDHRGTRFHSELTHLERLRVLAPLGQILADNTLKPGAPVLLWLLSNCQERHPVAASWSVPEFASDICEDWMTVTECRP